MCLMALLVVNGALLLRGERRLTRGDARAWARLRSDRRGQPRLVVLDDAGRCSTSKYRIAVMKTNNDASQCSDCPARQRG